MKSFLKICLLLLPAFANGQKIVPMDTLLNSRWIAASKDWRFQKGDNKDWASPEFDDASWKQFSFQNLNMPDGKHAIANRGEIVWFRKHVKADNSITDALVLNISQYGASEIYLDGKLIHRLGTVSTDINQIVYNNPRLKILQLPLQKGKEQVLAIRYLNAQYKFPLYSTTNGYIQVAVSTLSNANSNDVIKNPIISIQKYRDRYYIVAGMAMLICIIFLSFFLFFPSEKINGYFSMCMAITSVYAFVVIEALNSSGILFWFDFVYSICIIAFCIVFLYCFYRIFNRPINATFKLFALLGIIFVGCFFLYNPNNLLPQLYSLLFFILMAILPLKYLSENRVAGILFSSTAFLNIFYLAILFLKDFGLIQLNLRNYIPFLNMTLPIALSIYLGYDFGKRSKDLRLTLERVQKLSKEKESILTSQKETLEQQVTARTAALNQSLEDLKSTQTQLIQSEKMASLGELTAGIAHEIQNPLNFVNNFSEVSTEMIQEIKEERAKNKDDRDEALQDEILDDISKNLEKISQHGNRASSIVKGMLEHSRNSSGVKELTDINTLADEYLKLSYHGLRAKDKSFNSGFETDLEENLPKIAIVPQDFGRVLLNLINNAFYAVNEKQKVENSIPNAGSYKPMVIINSKKTNGKIEMNIKDNGNGIPQAIRDKIFQPFFTTKPTGKGTGLGLSLAYDIVKAHGGELKVETKEGEGSEFIIQLPIN